MYSVTKSISMVKQPYGGYLNSEFLLLLNTVKEEKFII